MKCRAKGCGVELSIHNHDRLCWRHRSERQRQAFLRGIPEQDTLTAAEKRRYVKGEW